MPAHRSRGLSLIETLTVVGLLALFAGTGVFMGLDAYRSSSFHSEKNTLVALLQQARARSMNSICTGAACADAKPHGVAIFAGQYVLFQGESYATRDTANDYRVATGPAFSFTGLSEVVFDPLSGTVAVPGDIVISDETGRVSTTTISGEGRISWTH